MKNIYLLPTDKPSRLYYWENKLVLGSLATTPINRNIYITSDEEIKKRDWCYHPLLKGGCIIQSKFDNPNSTMKKIILTTDQDLIKDGVQAIDDEFLEWFVKNPSCEEVEVSYNVLKPFQSKKKGYLIHCPDNEVLEEPKQETFEDASENYARKQCEDMYDDEGLTGANWGWEVALDFKEGAKWQAERSYSKEEVLAFGKSCFYKGFEKAENDDANCYTAFREEIGTLFEQFKKK